MPTLKLSSIVCEVPEESDKDEIYLKFRDKKIWPQKGKYQQIDTDETLHIGLSIKIERTGTLKLDLWEYDLTSKDDHLGVFQLEITSLDPGRFTELLVRDEEGAERASYYINWEIRE
ncbi:hypothetical protein [Marinoscillum sp. MHG1-6]|uniref:hypothetical protein n=1 Tax=Marinoscillum sp. MHG1-6 TaxID=2959627 RepID=UPI00215743C7|nr:hypothetical protein [Marinoscillum sp. MHG1-6]